MLAIGAQTAHAFLISANANVNGTIASSQVSERTLVDACRSGQICARPA